MRRKLGIVIAVCAAVALVGTTSAAAWSYSTDDNRPVGTWHEAPAAVRKPVALVRTAGAQQVGRVVRVTAARDVYHYPGASYVKLHFSRITAARGGYLTVSKPDGTESYRYATPATDKWAMSISGDTARLRLHGARVQVDRVARGYTPKEQTRAGQGRREESVCGGDESADAACYKSADPVAYTRSRAIARLLINGTELCTAWRVGPKNRLLTNNHCLSTTAGAFETEVWFNYQCASCGGHDAYQPTKVWGSKVLATDHVYDYTLFSVGNFAGVRKFGYLVLDTARPVKGQELYIPQHPAGQPTRIAGSRGERAGTCAVASNSYTGYAARSDVSYYCDTEGGSSGSPVLSRRTNRVVAMHHFGGCPNSGVRADLLTVKLKSLL